MDKLLRILALAVFFYLTSCGGGGTGGDVNNVTYTLGGTVAGLTGTGLVLQNNGGSDLSITNNGDFVFPNPFPEGSTYEVTVAQQPGGQKCLVENGTGYLFHNITDVAVSCSEISSAVTPLYPINGAEWNDYVKNDGATRLTATDTPCDPVAGHCLHGGEMRVWRSGQAISCAGLNVHDALDAFNWVCDDSSGETEFISTGLKTGKRLSDLIDFDQLVWRDNQVIVSGAVDLSSPSGKWWAVPIEAANNGGSLRSRRIYVVTTNPHASYGLDADKLALVVRPGVVLQGPGGGDAVIMSNSTLGAPVSYLWIEGAVDGNGAGSGVYLFGSYNSVLRGVEVYNAQTGIALAITSNNVLSDLQTYNNSGTGIVLGRVPNNSVSNLVTTNNGGDGVAVFNVAGDPNSHSNRFYNVLSVNNAGNGVSLERTDDALLQTVISVGNGMAGVRMWMSNATLLSEVTSVNNAADGVQCDNATLTGIVAVNNGGIGIPFSGTDSAINVASASNGGIGISLDYHTTVYFSGLLKVGGNAGGNCWAATGTGAAQGLLSDCSNQGASDAILSTGVNVGGSFVGKITTDDPENSSDSNGAALFQDITDWTHFANPMRAWSADGTTFPNAGGCVSGVSCRIWDWSLASADTVLREVLTLPTGNDVLTHLWSAANLTDCTAIPGANWNSTMNTCTSTFLRNAVEIPDDDKGNDNGLCESEEVCLFTPNLGAYQGHGDLQSAGTFVDGTLSGITLLRYANNGR